MISSDVFSMALGGHSTFSLPSPRNRAGPRSYPCLLALSSTARVRQQERIYHLVDILTTEPTSSGSTPLDNFAAEPKRGDSGHPSERRDVRRAMEHWHRNTWGNDCIPFLDIF